MKREAANVLDEEKEQVGCYFIFRNGEEDGPFSRQELLDLREAGKVSPATPCRPRKESEWHDLAFVLSQGAEQEIVVREPPPKQESQAPVAPSRDDSLRDMVRELVQVSRRQNRQLIVIKWSLLAMIALTAALFLAVR